jgi:hypothetical protein
MPVSPRQGPRRVQRGFIQLLAAEATKSATVSAIADVNRAEIRLLGFNITSGGNVSHAPAIKLTNSTTIFATRLLSGFQCDLEWELTEW